MGRKFYDDFTKEPIDKMAQSIVDMTYCYDSTIVPKKHYKEILEKDIIEIASTDTNVEFALLKPYYDMIEQMNKENRKYFVKALIMHELKLKYNTIDSKNVFALSVTWDYIEDNKIKQIIDNNIVDFFKNVSVNNVENSDNNNIN